MRLWAAAGVAVVAAALGAGIAVLVAHETVADDATTVTREAVPLPSAVPTRSVPPAAFDPAALYADRADGVVTIYANLGADGSSQGSGFVVDDDGLVLTNAHVITNVSESRSSAVRGASAVYVEFSDGDRVRADIVGWDLFSDVGVVRVSASDHRLSPVPLGKNTIAAVDRDRVVVAKNERWELEIYDRGGTLTQLIRVAQPPQGYFAPRNDPIEQALAARELAAMIGEFEKPRYFLYKESICAHSRSEITGCSRCIDVCSTQAIASDKEKNRVKVEPHLCMGCGGCATVCPSGAMSYAYPRVPDIGNRIKAVLQTYRAVAHEC